MFRNARQMGRWMAIAVAIALFCSTQAPAKKPVKPPTDEGGELRLVELHPPGSEGSGAYAINDAACLAPGLHLAVGRSADVDYGHVATAWDLITADEGTCTVFGSTVLVPDSAGEAFAVTPRGHVTGVVKYGNTAFVIREGSLTLLSSGGNNEYGIGYDLNDSEVVGRTGPSWLSDYMIATQWNSRNRRQDLARKYLDASWSFTSAEGINASGEIVGSGTGGAWLLRRQ